MLELVGGASGVVGGDMCLLYKHKAQLEQDFITGGLECVWNNGHPFFSSDQ